MIYIDDRTGSADLLSTFEAHRSHPTCQLTRLSSADFCFSGNGPLGPCMVGIERKRLTRNKSRDDGMQFRDICQSIRYGRLAGEQLPKLVDQYEYVYLIVEGITKTDRSSGHLMHLTGREWELVTMGRSPFHASELFSFTTSVGINSKVQIITTQTPEDTVERVMHLYRYFHKPWPSHCEHASLYDNSTNVLLGKAGTVRRVAAALTGIGWEKSGTVAEYFKTVEDMVAADVKAWRKLPGFGKVLAERVWKELRGQYESGDGLEL